MFYEEDTQVAQQAYGKTPTRLTVRLESLALDRRQEAVGVLVSGFPQRSGGRCLALVPVGPQSPSFHPCSTTALFFHRRQITSRRRKSRLRGVCSFLLAVAPLTFRAQLDCCVFGTEDVGLWPAPADR